jgi:hypothetical protein
MSAGLEPDSGAQDSKSYYPLLVGPTRRRRASSQDITDRAAGHRFSVEGEVEDVHRDVLGTVGAVAAILGGALWAI